MAETARTARTTGTRTSRAQRGAPPRGATARTDAVRTRPPAAAANGARRRRATTDAAPEPFATRRRRLMRALRGGERTAAVFVAAREALRNGDVEYRFRQDSTFHYLTGFDEPQAVAVLRPGAEHPYVLFVRPFDPDLAIWVGPRAGVEGAVRRFGADAAYPLEELDRRLPELLADREAIAYSFGTDEEMDRRMVRLAATRRQTAARGAVALDRFVDPAPLVARQRLVKTREEVASLQRAVDVTAAGFEAAMRHTRPGVHEYELQARLEEAFRAGGSPRNGYPSIVATGRNACTLHYIDNRERVGRRDLVLIDAGAEVDYYSADVTRTYPASGAFTAEQRAVYDVVLQAQREAIALARPGARLHQLHERAVEVLTTGLRDLGVLSGRVPTLVKQHAYAPYYMHSTSHWLGLDVHDAGDYVEDGRSIELRPGMVFTVEPGLYIAPDAEVPRPLRGIGVRIEDDILITRQGHRNLSAAIPVEPAALEALAGSAR